MSRQFICDCGKKEWAVFKKYHYDFIFVCPRCGATEKVISLVDLQLLCDKNSSEENFPFDILKDMNEFLGKISKLKDNVEE